MTFKKQLDLIVQVETIQIAGQSKKQVQNQPSTLSAKLQDNMGHNYSRL